MWTQALEDQRYRVYLRRPGGYADPLSKPLSRSRAEALQARITPRQPKGTETWLERVYPERSK